MKVNQTLVAAGALMVAVSVGAWTAEAGQRDREGRDRNGRSSQGSSERRGGDGAAQRGDGGQDRGSRAQAARPEERSARPEERSAPPRERDAAPQPRYDANRDGRQAVPRPAPEYRNDRSRDNDRYRNDGRYRNDDRYRVYRDRDDYRYAPRVYRQPPRRYYGPGGNFSVYFGLGNGYLYGSPWSGRVYGYRAPYAYSTRVYYGDVRLMVQPRDAAVYVDGYYAGVVDNFDGVFQRLTLEVGPHTIELDAPGLEPQVYDVYVDPLRTTTIRTDLFR